MRTTLNIDPGFAWLGWSVTMLGEDEDEDWIVAMGLIRTEKSDKKRHVLASDDNWRRAKFIAKGLHRLIQEHNPAALCLEAESAVRGASASRKVGITYGVLATLSSQYGLPAVMPSPQQVRKTLGAASKKNVAKMMFTKFRKHAKSKAAVNAFLHTYEKNAANHNHAWDSLGVLVSSVDSEVLRAIRAA